MAGKQVDGSEVHRNKAVVEEAAKYLDLLQKGNVPRYTFGWGKEVDVRTGGMEPENLIVVAGGNKQGKTLAAVNTVYANLEAARRVLVVTTEISAKWYLYRVASRSLGISLARIRQGSLTSQEYSQVVHELSRFSTLTIGDHPHCRFKDIEKDVETNKPDIVVIDHFQRLDPEAHSEASGYKKISQLLKQLAVTYRIPVLVLSQTHLDDGWVKYENGHYEYDHTKMRTRWTNELHGEADKVLYLNNLGFSLQSKGVHIIYHSMRDYPSGGFTPLDIQEEVQYLGEPKGGPY